MSRQQKRYEQVRVLPTLVVCILLSACASSIRQPSNGIELVSPTLMTAHDFSLADTPNKRTALAYLYTAWNDGRLSEARQTYWAPGSFSQSQRAVRPPPPGESPTAIPSIRYTIKKVIEEGNQVAVLAFVEGFGIGQPITTPFGTAAGTKIGDAVVEIFEFGPDGLIRRKWDTIEPLSDATYDFR